MLFLLSVFDLVKCTKTIYSYVILCVKEMHTDKYGIGPFNILYFVKNLVSI